MGFGMPAAIDIHDPLHEHVATLASAPLCGTHALCMGSLHINGIGDAPPWNPILTCSRAAAPWTQAMHPNLDLAADRTAMVATKKNKRDALTLWSTFLARSLPVSSQEMAGIMKWVTALRPGCKKKQLPMALKVITYLVRPAFNLA